MTLTKRINTFIKEAAERSAQVSCFAHSQDIAIPLKLRDVIDMEYISKVF